jgi:hypothetical protein
MAFLICFVFCSIQTAWVSEGAEEDWNIRAVGWDCAILCREPHENCVHEVELRNPTELHSAERY